MAPETEHREVHDKLTSILGTEAVLSNHLEFYSSDIFGTDKIAATCFGMDPMLQYQRIKRASMLQGVKALKGVVSSAKSTFSGIRSAMRIAVAGKRFIDENGYPLHRVVEGGNAPRSTANSPRSVNSALPKAMKSRAPYRA